MLYAVRFHDRPDQLAIRQAQMQAHLDWLDWHRNTILIAGSLREAPGMPPQGGLWLVEADSRADIEALLQTDPFWIHGLRASYEIFFWSKAFPDRQALI